MANPEASTTTTTNVEKNADVIAQQPRGRGSGSGSSSSSSSSSSSTTTRSSRKPPGDAPNDNDRKPPDGGKEEQDLEATGDGQGGGRIDGQIDPGGDTQRISFRPVEKVDVKVRELRITAAVGGGGAGGIFGLLKGQGKGKGDGDGSGRPPRAERKVILESVHADMPSGELMAIIGGSGSGKTSMLNLMANRMTSTNIQTSGRVLYNDNDKPTHTHTHAYVMQQDVLIPTLTVRETLLYSAELRLPSHITHAERVQIVEEVILQLGLKDCADTRVGDGERHRGCSGGEKRRCSIGVQMLANPSVLFLDEPTTGLDAASAFRLVETLKGLARRGRTVVMTIHQPRSEIWSLFDRITLLSRGHQLYSGPTSHAARYFAELGFVFPSHENPADFLIDISAVDSRTPEAEQASTARVERLVSAWKAYLAKGGEGGVGREISGVVGRSAGGEEIGGEKAAGSESGNEISTLPANTSPTSDGKQNPKPEADDISAHGHPPNNHVPFLRQLTVLTRRTFVTTYRDPMGITGSYLEALLMGVVNGWIFYQLDGSIAGIRSRHAALYITSSLQGYLVMLYETYRLTSMDMKVFDRERGEGVVGVLPWLLSRRLARLVTEDVVVPFLFSVIMYFMIGFENDAGQFFRFFAVIFVGQMLAVTFATLCAACSREYAQASLIGNLSFTMQSLSAGYFLQTTSMPVYVRWIRWIAYVHYAFATLCSNEFTDKFYDCPDGGMPSDPRCLEYRGDFILKTQLGLREDWYTIPMIIMSGTAVLFYIAAGILLRFWTVDINMSKPRVSNEEDMSAGKERMRERTRDEVKIDVQLEGVGLSVLKKGLWRWVVGCVWWRGLRERLGEVRPKEVVGGVCTRFEAGKLNVIMGPSGCGKTSLLNLMARRIKSTPTTRYTSVGSMKFNGAVPSEEVIRSLCSYVTQDDDALLPSLTVRETLRFAAGLRLPKWMSKSEKIKRAEDIILKLGLKDCADNLIGDEFIKGISGGERRRVTIAVQILTEPKILLLDEPTSGLDAFTAASIMSVLRALADEGRTVITTIHQSRADLFEQFGNVLLLSTGDGAGGPASGGRMVYSGPAGAMLEYFASLGYVCPESTNPADFALDLVTVDLQSREKELASRMRVRDLLERFVRHEELAVKPAERRKGQVDVGDDEKAGEIQEIEKADAEVNEANPTKPPSTPIGKPKILLPAELGHMIREKSPFTTAYPILLRRSLLSLLRQPQIIMARLMQVLGFTIILALFFSPLGHDFPAVQNRIGVAQQFTSLYFVGMLQNVAVYPKERDAFYREHRDGVYSATSFFLAYTTLEMPFEAITALLFALIQVFAIGLPRDLVVFFVAAGNAFAVVWAGESLGIVFNTLFEHTGFAINITSTVLSIATTMAGPMSIDMPGVLKALNYLSPLRYMVRSVAQYTLRGVVFGCGEGERKVGGEGVEGECLIATGEEALSLYKLDGEDRRVMLVGLFVSVVLYRLLAYLVLRVKMVEFGWLSRRRR